MGIMRWRLCVIAALLFCGVIAEPDRVVAQQTYLYSEPTSCPASMRPISGVTYHAGHGWAITWTTVPGQWASATYYGPSSATSTDGKATWLNPSLLAECWIDWYALPPTPARDAYFRWHIVRYFGTVREVKAGCNDDTRLVDDFGNDVQGPYDPTYDPALESGTDCEDESSEGGSGGGGGGGGDLTCRQEYVYVEISNDGGLTWEVYWEGYATVCE